MYTDNSNPLPASPHPKNTNIISNESPKGDLPCGAALIGRVHEKKDVHPGARQTYGTCRGLAGHLRIITLNGQNNKGRRRHKKGTSRTISGSKSRCLHATQMLTMYFFIWTNDYSIVQKTCNKPFRQDTAQESHRCFGLVPTVD